MKNGIALSVIVLFFGIAAPCQQNTAIQSITLSKLSRGYEEHIRLTPDSLNVWIENSRGEKPPVSYSRKLSKEAWINLVRTAEDLTLKDLPALPSPTMKRAVDAAMHSSITITTADGRSYAHGYDDEDPHEALRPLLKAIRESSGTEEEH